MRESTRLFTSPKARVIARTGNRIANLHCPPNLAILRIDSQSWQNSTVDVVQPAFCGDPAMTLACDDAVRQGSVFKRGRHDWPTINGRMQE